MNRRKSSRRIVSSLLGAALALASMSVASRAQSLFSTSNVGLGGGTAPNAIASGDLNGDGNLDYVTENYLTDNFTVLLGDGAGNFTPSLVGFASPFGTQTSSFVLIETSGDKMLDLVASTFYNPAIGIMKGTGTGAFNAPTGVNLPVTTIGVQAADFTGDGRADMLANSYSNDEFELVTALGGGSFSYTSSISFASPFGTVLGTFGIADFNLDGKLDFASATFYTAGFGVLLGSGGGAFGSPTLFVSGSSTDALATGDLNSDGIPDVALLDTGVELVRPWLGDGTGSFLAGSTLKTRPNPFGLAVGDVSGDGRADVVITESFTDKVRVYVGTASGFAPTDLYIAGNDPQLIAFGDFDSDGHMDLAVANVGSNNVTLLHGTTATPTGCSLYGTGTSGASGRLGINANQTPAPNTPTFAVSQTNAPADKIGLLLIANVQDLAGSDPLGAGFLLHVNLAASSFFLGLNFDSDGHGAGIAGVPIPNNPSLSGVTVFAQGLWLETITETCSPSPFGVVTSKGLSITIQ